MRLALVLAALLLVLGGVAAGCGGDDGAEEAAPPAAETTDAVDTDMDAGAVDGAAVFASAGCGGCHTLAAAGSGGSVGPNLDDARPDVETVVDTVTNGRGAMPSFSDQLSDDEIQAVAEYVSSSAGS